MLMFVYEVALTDPNAITNAIARIGISLFIVLFLIFIKIILFVKMLKI